MLLCVELQVTPHVAMHERAGGDHFRIQETLRIDLPQEIPAMTIGDVHHRRHAEAMAHRLPHVHEPPTGQLDHARHLVIVWADAGGSRVPAARAFGVAVLPPAIVRLAVRLGEGLALAAAVALAGFLEAVRVGQREVRLGELQQELETGAGVRAHGFVTHALRHRGGVAARQPVKEHRPLLLGEQADEAELRARRIVEHHCAVAGQDGGNELAAGFAGIALDHQARVTLDHDLLRGVRVAEELLLGVYPAGLDGRTAVLRHCFTTNKNQKQEKGESHCCVFLYWPVDCARARTRPKRLSVNGARTPAFSAISSVPASRPSTSSGLPASRSCSIEVLNLPRMRAMSMRASGSMSASTPTARPMASTSRMMPTM